MKSFSLPASFYEEIAAMHDKLAVKMFRAVYEYMYSDGRDTSIDRIVTIEGADFIIRFKAWAQKKFEQAALRRQRAAERRRQRREAKDMSKDTPKDTPKDGELPAPQTARQTNTPQPGTPQKLSHDYIPTDEDQKEFGIVGYTIDRLRDFVFRETGDTRIFSLRYDKVVLIYLLNLGYTLDPHIFNIYQENLYKRYTLRS